MKVPNHITHYYLSETGPLRSLSDLSLGGDDPTFLELLTRHKHDSGYRRRFGSDYIERRREIEARLRSLFLERGGRPRREHPFYFVLGNSPWFKNLNAGHEELKVQLSSLNPQTVSITFPDSFIALTRDTKPYHNQIFLPGELEEMVQQYGLPSNDHAVPYERYWETDFELYVEVQVWDTPENIMKAKN